MKRINLENKVFTRLKVLHSVGRDKFGNCLWKCICTCGKYTIVTSNRLIKQQTKSCGCYGKDKRADALRLKLIDKKFGKLVVLKLSKISKSRTYWECLCECGKECIVMGSNLTRGNTTSCGCKLVSNQSPKTRVYNIVYSRYKCEAKTNKKEFMLTYEQFTKILQSPCNYCGSPPSNISAKQNKNIKYSSVDRIDSKLGYTYNNTQPLCSMCNTMKLHHTEKDFKTHISKIFNYLNPNSDFH